MCLSVRSFITTHSKDLGQCKAWTVKISILCSKYFSKIFQNFSKIFSKIFQNFSKSFPIFQKFLQIFPIFKKNFQKYFNFLKKIFQDYFLSMILWFLARIRGPSGPEILVEYIFLKPLQPPTCVICKQYWKLVSHYTLSLYVVGWTSEVK